MCFVWHRGRTPGEGNGRMAGGDTSRARKICAIGVRSSHFLHHAWIGTECEYRLRYFSYINPCGFIDKGVTSLQKELGHEVPMEEVKECLCKELVNLLS